MTESESGAPAGGAAGGPELPEARVQEKSRFSIVWLIPIVAALVGAWLVYTALTERGPEIEIHFRTAEGLEAGKTKVKYKEVEVGLVESVDLSEDLSGVVVTARLVAGAGRYLTETTQFWVVRARVSAGQVSGIGTVLSGAYIGMDPSTQGVPQRVFQGLEAPPVVTQDQAGTLFTLTSDELGSVEIGAPVYFRWIRVGQVASYELDDSGEGLRIQVFVNAPHDARVTDETRFWNASGIDVSMGAEGVQVDTVSLVSMLIGGIAFDTPLGPDPGDPVEPGATFHLYANKRATTRPHYSLRRRWLLHFDQSVAGLVPGSPVEFRGIKIGEVQDVRLVYDAANAAATIPVVVETQPERMTVINETGDVGADIESLVARGMRAQLKTGNLLTGQLAINLDFFPDAPPARVEFGGEYPEIPTVPSPLDQITASAAQIATRLAQVPIEEIGNQVASSLEKLDGTLTELRGVTAQANRDLVPSLVATVAQVEHTMESVDSMIDPNSPTGRELRRLVLELSEAAQSMRLLADQLEQNPEDLLRGKSE